MNRCAIYARFSSDLQRTTSLEDQIRNCRQFAARMGWQVVEDHVYQDAALSGFGVEHRPAYQHLVAAALTSPSPFTVVLVDDLSRLSRDLVETLRLYRRLKQHGVELVAVADGIQSSNQTAKLQITIKGLVNELYLDDLRAKTHRGLTGRALKGLSTGGRLFGYRTRPGADGAEWVIDEPEAHIVRRIFQMYADGQSLKAIAVQLNTEQIQFPAKPTRRGPTRLGWAVSSIHTVLRNEKYEGHWVWNKTMFLKDAETGKRAATARPKEDWVIEECPDLVIVDADLWRRVQERLQVVRAAYGVGGSHRRPRGQAPELYSPHLLSGLLRCGLCGARITIQTSQRKKNGVVYRYWRYRCSFHVTKGSAVCANGMSIRRDVLDAKLLERFKTALTPEMLEYLITATNQLLLELHEVTPQEIEALTGARRQTEQELDNLITFVAQGDLASPRLREEIQVREHRLGELDQQLERLRTTRPSVPAPIDSAWIHHQLDALNQLLARDPAGARREIQKHVEDLRIAPAPEAGDRAVRIVGRAKIDGLLGAEEAVRLQLVAGAGSEPATFGLSCRHRGG
jgi:site-specific DNA recombinase